MEDLRIAKTKKQEPKENGRRRFQCQEWKDAQEDCEDVLQALLTLTGGGVAVENLIQLYGDSRERAALAMERAGVTKWEDMIRLSMELLEGGAAANA